MALNTVKLNGGTAGNPVVLSARQINGLIALYKDSNVTKDCSGYVKAASGKLTKSEYIYIQNLGFTIVDTVTTPDKFTLYAANNNILYEGKSVQLYSTGIDIKDLVLSVAIHEIVINSGAISEEVIKNRIHISETGLVTVDDAEENATWQDVVTIQAYPSFDPTNKVLISNPITIKGVAMSGVNITVASSVIIGGRLNVEVNVLPADHSKNNYRLSVFANDGTISNNTYIAPTYKVETAIVAECFLFGGNIATFHVEKKVSVKTPVIICEIKDKDGEEVPGAYISVTDGTNQIITQLSNGESMTAVLNRTYTIEAFVPEGYTKAIYPESITPKGVETIITATYYPVQLGVFAYFDNGEYIHYDEWIALGLPKEYNGGRLLGASIQTEDLKMIGLFESTVKLPIYKDNRTEIPIGKVEEFDLEIISQEQTRTISDAVAIYISSISDTQELAHIKAYNSVYTINDTEYRGRLPNAKETQVIVANRDNIKTICSSINKNVVSIYNEEHLWLAYNSGIYNNGRLNWANSYFKNYVYQNAYANNNIFIDSVKSVLIIFDL